MKLLQVIPNPYKMLDGNGKPTAVFPCHTRHAPGEFVGATKTLDVTAPAKFVDIKSKRGVRREVAQYDRSKAVFAFSFEPVDVPADGEIGAYYKRGVRSGAITPANKETAVACGVPFVPAKEALAKHRETAAQEFQRQFGEMPSWANEEQPAPIVAPQ